jgi:hypothetical protein
MLTNCTVNFLFPLGCSENVEISKKINRLLSLIFKKKKSLFINLIKKHTQKLLFGFSESYKKKMGSNTACRE